jgi:quercetin dioxygenase-like cupin family protein
MRRATLLLLLLSSLLLLAQQATQPEVPVDQEPRHHLFLANDTVRIFKVEVAPHDRTLMHRHDRDYAFVILGDADIINARQGETRGLEQKLKMGDTAFARGGFAHIAINNADTPFRNITIEIVKAKPDPNPEPFVTLAGAGMGVTQLVNNDRIHAELYELAPGAITPAHQHKLPHVAVFLNDSTIENVMDGKKRDDKWTNGDVVWVGSVPFTHTLQNMGTTTARWVTIEIK